MTDWLLRCRGARNVMWTARTARVSSGADSSGIPYMVVGRQVLECRYGPERHSKQKKKRLLSVGITVVLEILFYVFQF